MRRATGELHQEVGVPRDAPAEAPLLSASSACAERVAAVVASTKASSVSRFVPCTYAALGSAVSP